MSTRVLSFGTAALCAGILLASAGVAAEPLVGEAALGGVKDDQPGVRRYLTADDLQAPGATPPSSGRSQIVRRADGMLPRVPDGFKAELVASGIENPRVLRFAPNGDLFVASSAANEIRVFRFDGEGAQPEQAATYASGGLNRPYGIAFYPPGERPEWVYVANAGSVVRFKYSAGDLAAQSEPEVVISGIPSGGHWTRDLAVSVDGERIFLSVGSRSNVAEEIDPGPPGGLATWAESKPLGLAWGAEDGRAAVFQFNPDGSDVRLFATGLRNCSGMTVQKETGALWCVVNERDGLGDNIPFDYATAVGAGKFYGWPWLYIGDHEDPRHRGARPDLSGKVTVPDVLFQAHSAPLNIAFQESDAWGADYSGDAFVAMHGSWNRAEPTGYKVVRLEIENGRATGVYEDFVTGFATGYGDVWGRPVGVAFAPGGSLFVSEDGSGTIWRVSRE